MALQPQEGGTILSSAFSQSGITVPVGYPPGDVRFNLAVPGSTTKVVIGVLALVGFALALRAVR